MSFWNYEMHEVQMAQAIAECILKESAKQKAVKVLKAEIELGVLSFLNPEQVEFWLKLSLEKTPADGAELEIKTVEAEILCQDCRYRGKLEMKDDPLFHYSLPLLSCPQCNSGKISIEKGRECMVKRIELLRK